MFEFWSLAKNMISGGVSAFLGGGGLKGKSITDNSSFNAGQSSSNKATPGKAQPTGIVEGLSLIHI